MDKKELELIIKEGEGLTIELKERKYWQGNYRENYQENYRGNY